MAEPFTVSAHASRANIEVWARAQGSNTRIESKPGQDGQTVLYARKMGRFEALFHRSSRNDRVQTARALVDRALQTDPPAVKPPVNRSGAKVLTQPTFKDLPKNLLESESFKTQATTLAQTLSGGTPEAASVAAHQLADTIAAALRQTPYSTQMRFALADPQAIAREMLSVSIAQAKEHAGKTGGDVLALPPDRLELLGTKTAVLQAAVEHAMSRLSDHAISETELSINGSTYRRSPAPLGGGAFGNTYIYRAVDPSALKKGDPETLVVKVPTDLMNVGAREAKILNPLREARALVNATGTGATEFAGNVARFHSAVRGTDGSVLVVMRLEEGGSAGKVFTKALDRLRSILPEKKITEQQYEDVSLTLLKDAIQGASRFHTGGQVAHFDLKIDNLLVSKEGVGRVADPGASRGLKDVDTVDSPADTLHFTPLAYTAPERFLGAATSSAADVYTLGLTLYEMLSKNGPLSLHINSHTHPLFTATDTDFSIAGMVAKAKEWSRDPSNVMVRPGSVPPGSLLEKFAGLINEMTHPSPGKRPTLMQILEHPLLNQPGQGSPETRELIKSLVLPKPASVAAPVQPVAVPVQNVPQPVNIPVVPNNIPGRVYIGGDPEVVPIRQSVELRESIGAEIDTMEDKEAEDREPVPAQSRTVGYVTPGRDLDKVELEESKDEPEVQSPNARGTYDTLSDVASSPLRSDLKGAYDVLTHQSDGSITPDDIDDRKV